MATLSQTAANVVAQEGASKKTVTAGETITAGMPVFKDTADDDKYKKSRANSSTTALVDGIALNGASDEQPLEIVYAGEVNLGGTLVAGQPYFVSEATAGAISDSYADYGTGDSPSIIGIAYSTSILRLALMPSGATL